MLSSSVLRINRRTKKNYGVASASRIDKSIGLFCKRALQKRQYSAKETYNLIDPTDRRHPIEVCVVCHRVCEVWSLWQTDITDCQVCDVCHRVCDSLSQSLKSVTDFTQHAQVLVSIRSECSTRCSECACASACVWPFSRRDATVAKWSKHCVLQHTVFASLYISSSTQCLLD